MIFTSLPDNYAPLSEGLVYRAELEQVRDTVDVEIINVGTGRTEGVCRFTGVDKIEIDIAHYVNRMFNPQPVDKPTGIYSADDRVAKVCIAIDGVRSPQRIFSLFACDGVPRMVSGLTYQRSIALGERDEIPLYAPKGGDVVIYIWQGSRMTDSHTFAIAPSQEVRVLAINTGEFDSGTTSVEVFFFGNLHDDYLTYRITERPQQRNRLSWLTSFGSIESYTFPARREVKLTASRERFYGSGGSLTRNVSEERSVTLTSDPEPSDMVAALEEIISSRAVWSVGGGRTVPVDVVSSECRYDADGSPAIISVEVRTSKRGEEKL